MKKIMIAISLAILAVAAVGSAWTVPSYAYDYTHAAKTMHVDPLEGLAKYTDRDSRERGAYSCYDGRMMNNIRFFQVESFDACVERWSTHWMNRGRDFTTAQSYMHNDLSIDTEQEFMVRHPQMFKGEGSKTIMGGIRPITPIAI